MGQVASPVEAAVDVALALVVLARQQLADRPVQAIVLVRVNEVLLQRRLAVRGLDRARRVPVAQGTRASREPSPLWSPTEKKSPTT